jgi:hypothetical protein
MTERHRISPAARASAVTLQSGGPAGEPEDICVVVCAGRRDIPALSRLAVRFAAQQRRTPWPVLLTDAYATLIDHALRHGSVDMPAHGQGVAVWLDRTVASASALAVANDRTGPAAAALREMLADPGPGVAHLYLVTLAADRRTTAALLAYRHRRLDRAAGTAYAIAHNDQERAALTASGYLPADSPPDGTCWRMLRPPAAARHPPTDAALAFWPPAIDR